MTKVYYEIGKGNALFKTSSYSEALDWKEKGWKIYTKFEKMGDAYDSEDLKKALN